MRSIKWPKMFNTNSTNVWREDEYLSATKQNTILLLHTERGEMFGDPYFGLLLEHYLFDQNNYILKDVIIDIIYTQLALFIPQLKVNRSNIRIIQDASKARLYCVFSGTNQISYEVDTYQLVLWTEADKAH